MLDFFADRTLPGEDPWSPFVPDRTDVASFWDLWLTADLIESCCLTPDHIPGWASAGRHSSVPFVVEGELLAN